MTFRNHHVFALLIGVLFFDVINNPNTFWASAQNNSVPLQSSNTTNLSTQENTTTTTLAPTTTTVAASSLQNETTVTTSPPPTGPNSTNETGAAPSPTNVTGIEPSAPPPPLGNHTIVPFPNNNINSTRKALYGEGCKFDDDISNREPSELRETCDGDSFLMCGDGKICSCINGLLYDELKQKCVIPVGELCGSNDLNLPAYVSQSKLECNYGICRVDNEKHICRPESDNMLILIDYNG